MMCRKASKSCELEIASQFVLGGVYRLLSSRHVFTRTTSFDFEGEPDTKHEGGATLQIYVVARCRLLFAHRSAIGPSATTSRAALPRTYIHCIQSSTDVIGLALLTQPLRA